MEPFVQASRNTRRSSPYTTITNLPPSTLRDYFYKRHHRRRISIESPRGKQASQESVEGTDFRCEFTKKSSPTALRNSGSHSVSQRPIFAGNCHAGGRSYESHELTSSIFLLTEYEWTVPLVKASAAFLQKLPWVRPSAGSRSISRVGGSASLDGAGRKRREEGERVKRMCCSHDVFHTPGNWI